MASSAKRFVKRTVGYPDPYVPTVTTTEWVKKTASKSPIDFVVDYLRSLFPIIGWIGRYNLGWLSGDLIAGITVGIVLVPQSMSYAQIATLEPQYGLYSAFVGVFIYCFFATSKDVSIGPVAVMSLTVSQIIKHVNQTHPDVWPAQTIATAVSFICGFIVLGIGILRLGWIVEFIPTPAVSGFMTGSAVNIAAGQVPGLMGITGFDTRAATYKVIINTLKGLPRTDLNAAFGLPALVALYAIRISLDRLSKRYPRRARTFFFISILRNGFVIIVLTIASWLSMRHRRNSKGNYPIKILQTVPSGFRHVGPPTINSSLISALASELPVATIILLLEHIAISKSFGRLNGYKINPNQELIAIGVTNTIGSVFNAYPATGSFSRSALKSKSGVRTPLAGIFTGIVVIVALYGLTPAFFWIPNAGLSAIIIHAVADLVAKPSQVYGFWRISPIEFVIWVATVLVTVFSTIENGIYTSIIASLVWLLIRVARPRGYFLGKVTLTLNSNQETSREVYVPLNSEDGKESKPGDIIVRPPEPGVIVYRYEESVLYPNCSLLNEALIDYVKEHTRRGKDMSGVSLSDRPWNDPGPRRGHEAEELARDSGKPLLKAIVLDFSSISHIDTTGVQALVDTRTEVERWADRKVEFHFANVLSRWIRRGLVAGGFGIGRPSAILPSEVAPVVSFDNLPRNDVDDLRTDDVEKVSRRRVSKSSAGGTSSPNEDFGQPGSLVFAETPFFHFDLPSAVKAAELGARANTESVRSSEDAASASKR
ncbi:high affinity sulfate permease [Fomitiporia mediterranea MF3/22]|uniref:high affinity sulfate permease n=1 Tax=Fomitiporia mediterranea (strain MF3/22) TaxID=694068 RepID=UPI00044074CE|nr:high affinity sulfate permease [Fomitiporia mediterranea MF3/22]EJD05905.1 high affinity sulfate permease [Fomitiporia mediterranea MF3/22]